MAIILKRPLAELDLLDIWDYIADDSPDRADDFLDRIESKLLVLAQNSAIASYSFIQDMIAQPLIKNYNAIAFRLPLSFH